MHPACQGRALTNGLVQAAWEAALPRGKASSVDMPGPQAHMFANHTKSHNYGKASDGSEIIKPERSDKSDRANYN